MKYIDQWLTGLGLEYILPKLKEQGITTPKRLAQLSLRDIYEIVGVEEPEDRKKLYYLIQRLQAILKKEQAGSDRADSNCDEAEAGSESAAPSIPEAEPKNVKGKPGPGPLRDAKLAKDVELSPKRTSSAHTRGSVGESVTSLGSDDDLKSLRLRKKSSASDLNDSSPGNVVASSHVPSQQAKKSLRTSSSAGHVSASVNYRGPVPVAPPPLMTEIGAATNALGRDSETDISIEISRSRAPRSSLLVPRTSAIRGEAEKDDKQQQRTALPKSTTAAAVKAISPVPVVVAVPGKLSNASAAPSQPQVLRRDPDIRRSYENLRPSPGRDLVVEDMPIRVVVRKRPISTIETNRGDRDVMDIHNGGIVLLHEPKVKVDLSKVVESHEFIFDDAFEATDSNEEIYNRTVKGLVTSIFNGGKATCFAYGQTGSGKTFTMMGSSPGNPSAASKNSGLYVLAARDIFIQLQSQSNKSLKVFCSCFEIYGGKLFDLLNDRSIIKCLEDSKQQVHLSGLSEHEVCSQQELLDLMTKAHNFRSVGSTGANLESSRSHQVLQIVVRAGSAANPIMNDAKARRPGGVVGRYSVAAPESKPLYGKLSFIDLAGSERGADVTGSSKQTRMEGAEINTSLLALKEVIRSLVYRKSNPAGHTPFRGSKLTQVLKDSFVGENTRTCMIACVSPSQFNCEHTLNTLRYADRVKEHAQTSTPSGAGSGANGAVLGLQRTPSCIEDYPPSPTRKDRLSAGSAVSFESKDDDSINGGIRGAQRTSFPATTPPRPTSAPIRDSLHPSPGSDSRGSLYGLGADADSNSSSIGESPSKSLLATNEKLQLAYIKQRSGAGARRGSGVSNSVASAKRDEDEEMNNCLRESLNFKSSSPPRIKVDQVSQDVDAVLAQKTVNVLGAHRSAITDMVEIMKEEMELVQNMENADDRDAEQYTARLEKLLEIKDAAIQQLYSEVKSFRRSKYEALASNVKLVTSPKSVKK